MIVGLLMVPVILTRRFIQLIHMKRIFFLVFVSFQVARAESQIVASDAGGCIQPEDTWALNGTVGSHNTYLSILNNGVISCHVIWETGNSRWIVEADADMNGSFETLLYSNTFASVPNPPSLGTGTWVDEGSGCGPLVQFTGAYTQGTLIVTPVTLVSFTGTSTLGKIELRWKTTWEQNNKHFLIQRSSNGENYRTLATIPSKAPGGNSSFDLDYLFTDDEPLDVAYYRLEQVDIDNHHKFSFVVTIDVRNETGTGIFPNPVKSTFYIRNPGPRIKQYILTNLAGQTVFRGSTAAGNEVDISVLRKGIYFLKLDGHVIKVVKE